MNPRIICKATRERNAKPARRKTGIVALELIMAAPIFLVLLLAVIQFGVFFTRMQTVALACRNGAELASQQGTLPPSGAVPDQVLEAIEQQLFASGIQWCRVRLEHNVGGTQTVLISGTCDCGPEDMLAAPLPPGSYVRVTVCVPLSELMPNLLAALGWSIAGPNYLAECTTVMQHES